MFADLPTPTTGQFFFRTPPIDLIISSDMSDLVSKKFIF